MNIHSHGHQYTREILGVKQLEADKICITFKTADHFGLDTIILSPEEFSEISTAIIVYRETK